MITATAAAVELRGLSLRFGRRLALSGIDLDLPVGERLALFGPNGSGKTTLIKVLAGLLPPFRGEVRIAGLTFRADAQRLRRSIGVISHHTYLYDDLTGEENLLFYARMFGLDSPKERAADALSLAGLDGRGRDKVRTYSRGMQQRLALARATLHDPDILLLDEPDAGLDQEAFTGIGRFLDRAQGPPRTVVMATHDLSLGRASCGSCAILDRGRIVHHGGMAGLTAPALEQLYWQRAT